MSEEKSLKEEIVELLKSKGLDVAEDAAIGVVKGLFEVLPAIVLKTENKYDDLLIPMLAVLEPKVMELLDGIDGKEG